MAAFVDPVFTELFAHGLIYTGTKCTITECSLCIRFSDMIRYGTGQMLRDLFMDYEKLIGCDCTALKLGTMTTEMCKAVLSKYHYETDTVVDENVVLETRLRASLAQHFPGIEVGRDIEQVPIYLGYAIPLLENANLLYTTLSTLYKITIGLSPRPTNKTSAIPLFVTRCFALNNAVTLNATAFITNNTIKKDTILLMWRASLLFPELTQNVGI